MQNDSLHMSRSVARRADRPAVVLGRVVQAGKVAQGVGALLAGTTPVDIAVADVAHMAVVAVAVAGPEAANVRCTLRLAAHAATRLAFHSFLVVTVPCIAATALGVSVTAGAVRPGRTTARFDASRHETHLIVG